MWLYIGGCHFRNKYCVAKSPDCTIRFHPAIIELLSLFQTRWIIEITCKGKNNFTQSPIWDCPIIAPRLLVNHISEILQDVGLQDKTRHKVAIHTNKMKKTQTRSLGGSQRVGLQAALLKWKTLWRICGGMRTVNSIRLQEIFVSYLQIMSNVSYVSLLYQLVEWLQIAKPLQERNIVGLRLQVTDQI